MYLPPSHQLLRCLLTLAFTECCIPQVSYLGRPEPLQLPLDLAGGLSTANFPRKEISWQTYLNKWKFFFYNNKNNNNKNLINNPPQKRQTNKTHPTLFCFEYLWKCCSFIKKLICFLFRSPRLRDGFSSGLHFLCRAHIGCCRSLLGIIIFNS